MRHHGGKTFLSQPKLFRAESALYFPNMQGYTLENPNGMQDTTNIFTGKTSIVSVFSGTWAERQTQTFVDEKENPILASEIEREEVSGLQKVWINIEEDWLKSGLIRLFLGNLKKKRAQKDWGRSFVVSRGVGEDTRKDIGMINGKVGYVYLVDGRCKIRWAGTADAAEGEKEGLVAALKRLVDSEKRQQGLAGEGKLPAKMAETKAAPLLEKEPAPSGEPANEKLSA